ncbi:MAG: AhpC/TSA family protein [Saprospiraceae bacterium]|nr:AhpC/TSA family protein [Saprospiraceae bacterium]
MSTLKSQLESKKAEYSEKWTTSNLAMHENGIAVVEKINITKKALQIGDTAPNFTLKNHLNKEINLYSLLKNGPVVLTWYRGGWCPYCNLSLRALQKALPEIKKQNATLLTLTAEIPDKSLSTKEKQALEFEVLSDLHNEIAKKFNIVFKLEENVATAYQNGFDLHAYNGDESDELPLAATYIINTNGLIQWAFLDADYRNRAEPSDIIEALKKIS